MRILGIDPGYGIVGFGLIDAQRSVYRFLNCGAITTPPNTEFAWRLATSVMPKMWYRPHFLNWWKRM